MTRVAFSAVGGWLGYFMGGCDGLMVALIVFVVADYTTGVMCAIVDKKLSSEVGFKGIFRKVMIFILVGMAHILDTGNRSRKCAAFSSDIFLPFKRRCITS